MQLIKALQHQRKIIKCSLADHFTFRKPVPVVFFYLKKIPIETIIQSLQHVLNDYPVFAGILIKHSDRLYIDCNNQGVQVDVQHSNLSLSEILSNLPQMKPSTFVDQFDPYQAFKDRKPVLTIKLHYFKDGLSIGYCWHHSVGDMSTFMSFLKALSAYAKGHLYEAPLIAEDRDGYLNEWLGQQETLPQMRKASKLKKMNLLDKLHFVKEVVSSKKIIYFYFTHEEVSALRSTLSEQTGLKLTRNTVLCAHFLNTLSKVRGDQAVTQYASLVVNYRTRIGMSPRVLGNYIDALSLQFEKPHQVSTMAQKIHGALENYVEEYFQYAGNEEFVQKNGGPQKIDRFIPEELLPQYKNFIVTNWCNFDAYSIDFGVSAPYLFVPVGKSPLNWVSCIFEGFENKGLFVAMILPSKVAKRLKDPAMLDQIHKYRTQMSPREASILAQCSWCY